LQQTPFWHAVPLQLTLQAPGPQVMRPAQLPSAQLICVSSLAPLSIKFWQAWLPLQSTRQELLPLPQLSLPGQLFSPLHSRLHLSASQRSSLVQLPCASQRTSHELPPHAMLPAQVLAAPHCTLQLAAPRQSTPLWQAPGAVQAT
jgi:hypothetical protein